MLAHTLQADLQNLEVADRLTEAGVIVLSDELEPEFSEEAMQRRRDEVAKMLDEFKAAADRELLASVNDEAVARKAGKQSAGKARNQGGGGSTTGVDKFSGRNVSPRTLATMFGRSSSKFAGREDVEISVHDISTLTKALDDHLAKPTSMVKVRDHVTSSS